MTAGLEVALPICNDPLVRPAWGGRRISCCGHSLRKVSWQPRSATHGTLKLNELNPAAYLRHVLERVAEHPMNRIEELVPWNVAIYEVTMIRFVLTEQDFVEGLLITKRWTVKRWLLVAVGPTVLYLCMGLYLIYYPDVADLRPMGIGLLMLIPLCWLLGFLAHLYYVPSRARKLFRERKHKSTEISWDEGAFTLTTDNGYSRTPWPEFSKWRESENVLLLSLSRQMYLNIPKRAFNPDELSDFIQHLRKHITAEPASA
jgi:hypothetical protein